MPRAAALLAARPKRIGRRLFGRRPILTVLLLGGLAPSPDVATILAVRAASRRPGLAQRQKPAY